MVLYFILLTFGFALPVDALFKYGVYQVFFTQDGLSGILFWGGPLILTALAVAIAFQGGLFNIGGQGQFIIGGLAGAIWAASIVPKNLPFLNFPLFMVPTTMLIGAIFGGIYGFLPGYMRAKYEAHEVITTILLNILALNIAQYLVGSRTYSPFVDRTKVDAYGQTELISKSATLSPIFPAFSQSVTYGLLVTVLIAVLMYFVLFYTRLGFKIRAVGLNKHAAEANGIKSDRITIITMTISGALAGLAGILLVQSSSVPRYSIGIEGTLGFDGIAVSLIGLNNPFGIILAAFFFGFLQQARLNLDTSTNIPSDLIFVFQALVVLFVAAPYLSRIVINKFQRFNKTQIIEIKEDST